MKTKDPISERYKKIFSHPAWSIIAAFGTYFCMYGFRKPYTAGSYNNVFFWGLDYKFLLIIAQTAGYVTAKWFGIKIISEVKPQQRVVMIIGLLLFAECMLLLFGIVPRPWNILCLLLNGLPLGVVFGLVLGFLEGRKNTELLIAGLCTSFIVSDGVSKSVGTFLLDRHIAENWMPFVAGLIFMIPTCLFITMLAFIPPPSEKDVASRSARIPMTGQSRREFFMKYSTGIVTITCTYLLVTLLRSIRSDFAVELWHGLGYQQTPATFTQSELWVSLGVILINGLCIFIANHYKAFHFSILTCVAGFVILLFAVGGTGYADDSFLFMVFTGLGVYIPYVAIHTTVFERLIAITKEKANIGFLMYIADAVGYTGYILLMLLKYFIPPGDSVLSIFMGLCISLGITGAALMMYCNWYFIEKFKKSKHDATQFSIG